MFSKQILLLVAVLVTANAFQFGARTRVGMSLRCEETQSVQDLNLEEMQEMFEAADEADPTPVKAAASSFDVNDQPGITLFPKGLWDPAGLSQGENEAQIKMYQEAETKHGRVAMLAFVGIVFGELFPNDVVNGPAIYQFQQIDAQYPFWIWALTSVAMVEVDSILKYWQSPEETFADPYGVAKLKSDHIPGDLKFDPRKIKPTDPEKYKVMKTKELNNGRLAMLAVAGIVAQELATGLKIF